MNITRFLIAITLLALLCRCPPTFGDFITRPGFGTKEGVLGSGYREPTNYRYAPPQETVALKPPIDYKHRRIDQSRLKHSTKKTQQALRTIRRELALLDPSDVKPIYDDVVAPKGSAFFYLGGGRNHVMRRSRGDGTPKSKISSENLRRAISIIRVFKSPQNPSSLSAEDLRFLAGQASLALMGAPLEVTVPESSPANDLTRSQIDDGLSRLSVIEKSLNDLEGIMDDQEQLEKEMAVHEVRIKRYKKSSNWTVQEARKGRKGLRKLEKDYAAQRQREIIARRAVENLQRDFRKSVGKEVAK